MNHFDILGRSIADPVVETYLAQHEKLDPIDFRKNAKIGFFGGFDSGFGLQVESLAAYSAQFEELRSRSLSDDEERIVTRLSFTGPDALRAVQRAYRSALPFGLTFGDSSAVVADKLGTGPVQETKSGTLPEYSAERFDHSHAVGNMIVIAKYDAALLLMAIYLIACRPHHAQGQAQKSVFSQPEDHVWQYR